MLLVTTLHLFVYISHRKSPWLHAEQRSTLSRCMAKIDSVSTCDKDNRKNNSVSTYDQDQSCLDVWQRSTLSRRKIKINSLSKCDKDQLCLEVWQRSSMSRCMTKINSVSTCDKDQLFLDGHLYLFMATIILTWRCHCNDIDWRMGFLFCFCTAVFAMRTR